MQNKEPRSRALKGQVLLANSYFYRFDKKQWKIAEPYPPLATITVAAYLRDRGYEIDFFDACLAQGPAEVAPLLDKKPSYFIIYDDGFNYLTKMCLTVMRTAAFDMIREAKSQGCVVIVSSSDSTDHYELYHEKGADYVIHGEGEETLGELLKHLEQDESIDQIAGLSRFMGGDVIKHVARPVMHALDSLPIAAWDLIDLAAYRKIWKDHHGYFRLNIATTRGCPYKCNWCAKPIYGNRYNTRTPEHVMQEIRLLNQEHDVSHFWMCDDIFGLKPRWVQEFRDLKKSASLNFQYKIQSRVDLMLKEDNLEALVESGLDIAWLGAESGSQRILDAMDKGTQVEQIYEATRKLKKHRIRVAFFLQFGYLGETFQDIRKTLKMVLDLMPDDIGISVSYPLPGTKFYDKVKNQLDTKANWTDSDDLDLMFANTYQPVFYKTLHRYVHHRYRIKKGWLAISTIFEKPVDKFYAIARMGYHLPLAVYRHILLRSYSRKSTA